MQGLSEKYYDPQKTDACWYHAWGEWEYFQSDVHATGEPFCTVIPPPKITGSLHMEYALNTTF